MKLRRYEYIFIGLLAGYLLLVAFMPIDPATVSRYKVSEFKLRMTGLSVSVLISIVWMVAMYASTRFKRYSESIRKTKEGIGYGLIANGLIALTLSLPATAIINNLLHRIAVVDPTYLPATTIMRNYLPVIVQLIVFYMIARGAGVLLATVKSKKPMLNTTAIAFSVIAAASIFSWFVMARPLGGTVEGNYFLPEWAVLLTIVIPLQFAWYFGMSAAYQLIAYSRFVKGVLYRHMLTNLVGGIALVTGVAILIQVAASVSEGLSRLNFTPVLMIVYGLIALYAVGFGLIARGAKTLKKIEEV